MITTQGETNQTTTEAGHEVDGVGADMVCCQYQIAFVLAVFLIDKYHHPPGAQFGNDV
jgi:hypothetical protein